MEEYVEMLKDFLKDKRNMKKVTYKTIGTIERAIKRGITTWEDEIKKINLGGTI